ncbi:YchJ family protein [Desulfoplanes formicivorans]|nr:YchJ family metal-binding protein [Desulfoplanes formicivorans]
MNTHHLLAQAKPRPCPCGSGLSFGSCCGPLLEGTSRPQTAEALMRSRFTAFATGRYAYLQQTVIPSLYDKFIPDDLARSTRHVRWTRLEIEGREAGTANDIQGTVIFSARYEHNNRQHIVRERSRFEKREGAWLYAGGHLLAENQVVGTGRSIGRNTPCPCGSGKKYKKCCGKHR